MKKMWRAVIVVAMAAALAGCHTTNGQEQEEESTAQPVEVEAPDHEAEGHAIEEVEPADEQGEAAQEESAPGGQVAQAEEVGDDQQLDTSGLEEARREGVLAHSQLWSEEGFTAQDRMDAAKHRGKDSDYSDPATTPWQESERDIPEELASEEEGYRSPSMVLNRVVEAMRFDQGLGTELWEMTQRVRMDGDDEARGIILRWGVKDDAMLGMDMRVSMSHGEEGWYVTKLEERWHCLRGVRDGLCT